ncbi:hypothetical protein TcWFU_008160 [Taenia crassiceps]|uniref:Uncharacterized protein n=1 Tax=Taenia crassiceps TaxID=6207 RepID=A0ABR4Q185_9CEST
MKASSEFLEAEQVLVCRLPDLLLICPHSDWLTWYSQMSLFVPRLQRGAKGSETRSRKCSGGGENKDMKGDWELEEETMKLVSGSVKHRLTVCASIEASVNRLACGDNAVLGALINAPP